MANYNFARFTSTNGNGKHHSNGQSKSQPTTRRITRRLKTVPINAINAAYYNPPPRTELHKLGALRKSLNDIGCIYPPLVDESLTLIDGHCRWTSEKENGATHIEVFVLSGVSAEEIYAQLNPTQRPLSSADWLYVYLANPNAVRPKVRAEMDNAVKVVGKMLLRKLWNKRLSMATYRQAKTLAKYCGQKDSKEFIKKALLWLLEHKQTCAARQAKDAEINAGELTLAIERNVPLSGC